MLYKKKKIIHEKKRNWMNIFAYIYIIYKSNKKKKLR